MRFSIITPSFNQLDWLRLCVASVKDQVKTPDSGFRIQDEGGSPARPPFAQNPKSKINNPKSTISPPLAVEHIIQDAGTPGIEEFAREIGADFYRDGQFISHSPFRISNYSLAVFCESDNGMYDAVNRGYARASGDVLAYLNCDEQYLPGTLKSVRDWFGVHPDKAVLFGDALVVRPDGSYLCSRKVSVPRRLYTLVSRNLSIFTAATFIWREVYELGVRFDTRYKDVGDAVWALELVRRRIEMGFYGSPLTTFTDTGENMNTRPNALREKEALFQSAPWWARKCRGLFIAAHRFHRLLLGAYSRAPLTYAIYLLSSPAKRIAFHVERQSHIWRLKNRPAGRDE